MNRRNFVKGVMAIAAGSAVARVARDRVEAGAPAIAPASAPVTGEVIDGPTMRYLEDRRTLSMANGAFAWSRVLPVREESHADFGPVSVGPYDAGEASQRDRYENLKAMSEGWYTLKIR
jgi:hypothetical protein